jgi:hypothetical protein
LVFQIIKIFGIPHNYGLASLYNEIKYFPKEFPKKEIESFSTLISRKLLDFLKKG